MRAALIAATLLITMLTSCAHTQTRKAAIYGRGVTDIEVRVRILDRRWTAHGCGVLEIGDPRLEVLRIPPQARWCARLDGVLAVPVVLGDPSVCSVCFPAPPTGGPPPVHLDQLSDAEVEAILIPPPGGD